MWLSETLIFWWVNDICELLYGYLAFLEKPGLYDLAFKVFISSEGLKIDSQTTLWGKKYTLLFVQ